MLIAIYMATHIGALIVGLITLNQGNTAHTVWYIGLAIVSAIFLATEDIINELKKQRK